MPDLKAFIKRFVGLGYRLVSTGDLTELQISEAKKEDRFFVDSDNLGYVALPWDLTTEKDEKRFSNKLKRQNKIIVDANQEE